ncbi:MAG: HAD family hydrolase [Candidatus Hodarchaeota archaeon]
MFDFDGTIADTMPVLETIAVDLLKKNYGISREFARLGYVSTTGLPFCQQIELLFPNHPFNQNVVDTFERKKLASIFEQPLFEDTIKTLELLKGKGYLVAISSSTIQSTIEEYCIRIKIADYLDLILGFSPGFEKGRAHFARACEAFNISPRNILFIGDSLKDGERALESQVAFIGKIGMFGHEDFAKIIPNCTTIAELSDLIELI